MPWELTSPGGLVEGGVALSLRQGEVHPPRAQPDRQGDQTAVFRAAEGGDSQPVGGAAAELVGLGGVHPHILHPRKRQMTRASTRPLTSHAHTSGRFCHTASWKGLTPCFALASASAPAP